MRHDTTMSETSRLPVKAFQRRPGRMAKRWGSIFSPVLFLLFRLLHLLCLGIWVVFRRSCISRLIYDYDYEYDSHDTHEQMDRMGTYA